MKEKRNNCISNKLADDSNPIPHDPLIPFLSIYLEKTILEKTHAPQCSFIAALFTIAKTWKQLKSTDRKLIKKMWCVYIYVYIYVCVMEY